MVSIFYVNKFIKRILGIILGILLILLIFFAAYGVWNYFFSSPAAPVIDRSNARQVAKRLEDEIKADLQLENQTLALNAPDFFTEYRLERDKLRSERTDLLRDILKNSKTDEIKNQAQNAILQMTLEKQLECEIENLIKSKGFGDALVFIRENSVSAVVKSASLSKEEVLQVADIISRISGAKAEDITVSAKP